MPNDSSTVLDLATIMSVTLITVSVIKPVLEVWVSPDQHLHDSLVQLLALLVGVAWSFVFVWAFGPATHAAALQTVVSIILGLGGGSASVGGYHMATAVKRAAVTTTGARNQSGAKDTANAQTRTLEVPAAAQVSVRLPPGMAPPPASDVPDVTGMAAVRAQPTTTTPDAAP